jgi:hypothetical protein
LGLGLGLFGVVRGCSGLRLGFGLGLGLGLGGGGWGLGWGWGGGLGLGLWRAQRSEVARCAAHTRSERPWPAAQHTKAQLCLARVRARGLGLRVAALGKVTIRGGVRGSKEQLCRSRKEQLAGRHGPMESAG